MNYPLSIKNISSFQRDESSERFISFERFSMLRDSKMRDLHVSEIN